MLARQTHSTHMSLTQNRVRAGEAVLTNGARYYVDHAHPEMSTPEVRSPLEAVIWDPGEEIIRKSIDAAQRLVPDGAELLIHKNNSDGKETLTAAMRIISSTGRCPLAR